MTWNWLGWILWILAIAFLVYVIHFIRVKQLMLIAKTKRRFDGKLFAQYVGLMLVAIIWLGGLISIHFFQPVDYNNQKQVWISTKYQPLEIHNTGTKFYFVKTNRSTAGKRPVVSYTYWSGSSKYTVSSRFSSVTDGARLVPLDASGLPWNQKRLAKLDRDSGHAYAAVMTAHYRNTVMNGLALRANHKAASYTAIRVLDNGMIDEH